MRCGIDPGRNKIGLAFADPAALLFSAIIPKSEERLLAEALRRGEWRLVERWRTEGSICDIEGQHVERIFLGGGTSSGDIETLLENVPRAEKVDEYGSTLEGRRLYWKLHPPSGLWRLIPTSLRVPPRDIDDLAAWAIIIKQWQT